MVHFLLLSLLLFQLSPPFLSLNQDGLTLLELKSSLEDPHNSLSNWNNRDDTPCKWSGITCDDSSLVTSIHLPNAGIAGPLPSSLCNLTGLSNLSLPLNFISSSLDSLPLDSCTSLIYLDLNNNILVGSLPSSLPSLPLLEYLDLSYNNFTGEIPSEFALFPNLKVLSLVNNLLDSHIPAFLSNVSTLTQLNLSYNPFTPASIPHSLGNLSSLETLWLSGCNLIGPIPESLGQLLNLKNLDMSYNQLTGSVPDSLTGLSSIVQIELYSNSLSGVLPTGFSNLTSLLKLDASMNRFEGPLPSDIFDIPNLESLHLYQNYIVGPIPASVSQLKGLTELRLFDNGLTGSLPPDLGVNSPLMFLDISYNNISGEIPTGICDGGALVDIMLVGNSFTGPIPVGLGNCKTLVRIRLSKNKLSGRIPNELWGLPHVGLLDISENLFSGEMSALVSEANNLSELLISDNNFSGSIPSEIGSLSNLNEFSAANNQLAGPIPSTLVNLPQLALLDLSNNSLSGELPMGIGSMKKLTELNLANNDFSGEIPPGLGDIPVLNYLDLSGNLLTGKIPLELQYLRLNQFNLSNNQLAGPLPPAFATQNYRTSFLNNPGLCGDLDGLCSDSDKDSGSHRGIAWLFFILAAFVLIIGVGWFYLRYKRFFKKPKLGSIKSKSKRNSFHKLGFSEHDILHSLNEDNVIGSGGSGKVYKVVLSSGQAVAVKKVPDRARNDAFDAEVAALRKIRHKNIVKLWLGCTQKESKLLVYEYLPNGSLGDLLYRNDKSSVLDWPRRRKIVLEAAEGISYLHHDCVPPIVHRDVKSNNILLDSNFSAKVADFCVVKAVDAIGKTPKSMTVIAGSCGYIAPEYAYTLRVNEKSDIYSFGVVILELVSGKAAFDPEFGEKDLVRWVCSTLEQKGMDDVIDPKLDVALFKEEIGKVLNIGLLCTSQLPMNRPPMKVVMNMLRELIKDDDKNTKAKQDKQEVDGNPSPFYIQV